jgi:hypothetical protein
VVGAVSSDGVGVFDRSRELEELIFAEVCRVMRIYGDRIMEIEDKGC